MDGKLPGVYIGVQPRSVDLFEYAPNVWRPAVGGEKSNCACDKDIEYITAVFFDIDVVSPDRKKGHPATDDELQNTLKAAYRLSRQDGLAFSSAICCSGNGHYILAPLVPLPVDNDEIAIQFNQFCRNLTTIIEDQVSGIKIDLVYNLSRVMRLMGTFNANGMKCFHGYK